MWRRLDLDDVCAPIAELADAGRPRTNAGQVEDGKARKGLGGPGERHSMAPEYVFWLRTGYSGRHSSICVGLSIGRNGRLQPLYPSFRGIRGVWRREKDIAGCHMSGADEGPGLGFCGPRARSSLKRISPRSSEITEPNDNPGNAGCP